MSRLVLANQLLARLRADLLRSDYETCAVLFGRSVEISGHLARIVVSDYQQPTADFYEIRTATRAQLRPEYVGEAVQRARASGESVVFAHTHPFSFDSFSNIDDAGEAALARLFRQRAPNARHGSMLITPSVSLARELGTNRPFRVCGVGETLSWGAKSLKSTDAAYDRQVRAFGREGQNILSRIRVGIVGLGGTGSVVLQQLVHLGVRDFLLVDPDIIEESNLNRVVGAIPSDVGKAKVTVASTWVKKFNPEASIEARAETILRADVARSLAEVDLVFCCTDSHGSRAVVNQLAYQYLIPVIDMGVVIATQQQRITHVSGRTQLLAPGLACMVCGNLLDAEEIRRDLLSDFERQADPYIIGNATPAPSVISLNSTIASIAVTMFLNVVVGTPGSARFINYDGLNGVCRPAFCEAHPTCVVCSRTGALARCDEWPLPARLS